MLLAISYTALVHKIYLIRADWDPEAAVWVVTSDDIPGLVTEAVTLEALIGKLQGMMPKLLQANGEAASQEIAYELLAKRFDVAQPNAVH